VRNDTSLTITYVHLMTSENDRDGLSAPTPGFFINVRNWRGDMMQADHCSVTSKEFCSFWNQ